MSECLCTDPRAWRRVTRARLPRSEGPRFEQGTVAPQRVAGRGAVGDGLVPSPVEFVEASSTGRDKPVPYDKGN